MEEILTWLGIGIGVAPLAWDMLSQQVGAGQGERMERIEDR